MFNIFELILESKDYVIFLLRLLTSVSDNTCI